MCTLRDLGMSCAEWTNLQSFKANEKKDFVVSMALVPTNIMADVVQLNQGSGYQGLNGKHMKQFKDSEARYHSKSSTVEATRLSSKWSNGTRTHLEAQSIISHRDGCFVLVILSVHGCSSGSYTHCLAGVHALALRSPTVSTVPRRQSRFRQVS
jgi:hypothetical protein